MKNVKLKTAIAYAVAPTIISERVLLLSELDFYERFESPPRTRGSDVNWIIHVVIHDFINLNLRRNVIVAILSNSDLI
jgi:hypothetical protein